MKEQRMLAVNCMSESLCLIVCSGDGSSASDVDGGSSESVGSRDGDCVQVVQVQGLDTLTVVGISFAAFLMGVLSTAALWLIHTHTGLFLFILTRKHMSNHHLLLTKI